MNLSIPASVENPARWNFKHLLAAWFIGFVLQNLFLVCLCDIGTAMMALAACFDGLVLLRAIVAYVRRETGRGWIFYSILCYTSVLWIKGITYLVLGEN